jgi:hypothetical protein
LPRVVAVVNAHHAAVVESDGLRDGPRSRKGRRWRPFTGAHYRLPGQPLEIPERHPVSVDGEIHLGPGRRLIRGGALCRLVGRRYRSNASHNAGIIYHEYGHHLTRHTADFRANGLRPALEQSNRKSALDEAVADYCAAVMMGTPHIWVLHHRHDDVAVHRRSLTSARTMASYDPSPTADPHANGTIWAAAAWEARTEIEATHLGDGCRMDLMMVQALATIGRRHGSTVHQTRRLRSGFAGGLSALLAADAALFRGAYRALLLRCFLRRGISPSDGVPRDHHRAEHCR